MYCIRSFYLSCQLVSVALQNLRSHFSIILILLYFQGFFFPLNCELVLSVAQPVKTVVLSDNNITPGKPFPQVRVCPSLCNLFWILCLCKQFGSCFLTPRTQSAGFKLSVLCTLYSVRQRSKRTGIYRPRKKSDPQHTTIHLPKPPAF